MGDFPLEKQFFKQMFRGSWITQGLSIAAELGIAELMFPGLMRNREFPYSPLGKCLSQGNHFPCVCFCLKNTQNYADFLVSDWKLHEYSTCYPLVGFAKIQMIHPDPATDRTPDFPVFHLQKDLGLDQIQFAKNPHKPPGMGRGYLAAAGMTQMGITPVGP